MPQLLIFLVIALLFGCQKTQNSWQKRPANKTHPIVYRDNKDPYNRYKNKKKRYILSYDKAPTQSHTLNFKEPVPKREPLSRYGNPIEYMVDGHHYEVLRHAKGYKAQGIASWYGMKFHKQRTSSGDPYDMYTMTAAHKTLPLPTYIKIKNLENGRETVVKVNDRGPFYTNRIVDLSYAAAVKLGVFPKGTARVEIQAIQGPLGNAQYYLQAGAFSSAQYAVLLQEKLRTFTLSPVKIEHYQEHYFVRLGPFKTKDQISSLQNILSKKGIYNTLPVLI